MVWIPETHHAVATKRTPRTTHKSIAAASIPAMGPSFPGEIVIASGNRLARPRLARGPYLLRARQELDRHVEAAPHALEDRHELGAIEIRSRPCTLCEGAHQAELTPHAEEDAE